MNYKSLCLVFLLSLLTSSVAECRVGGGRSFGNRGSRGFSMPRTPYSNPNPRQYNSPNQAQPSRPVPTYGYNPAPSTRGTFMRSLGAGIAGGMIGGMISRALGGGGASGYGAYQTGATGGGGIGLFEMLLIGGILYGLYRFFANRSQAQASNAGYNNFSGGNSSGNHLRDVSLQKLDHYSTNDSSMNSSGERTFDGTPIDTDLAMDLFFQIQGAWSNRDLGSVQPLLDADARSYLQQEITRLKNARQINRLENIAVRTVEAVESWKENNQDYSTVRFHANLLDFTLSEDTQQVVEGSKTSPVKFEEFWTFTREGRSSPWKLSAIQQS